ncbi:MAG: hypothetical protein ABTQ34_09885 [Bdellovibrionales bacterium]
MFGLFRKKTPATACGSCQVKTNDNCSSHLSHAATAVAQAFIENKTIFNPQNPQHMQIVGAILKDDLTDDKGNPVSYEVPKEPNLQRWFHGLVAQQVSTALFKN